MWSDETELNMVASLTEVRWFNRSAAAVANYIALPFGSAKLSEN
jgi:hypothetical protein